MKNLRLDNLPFNWFDLILIGVLILGVFRGRKRGMSLEMFTMLHWIVLIFACALGYDPLGRVLTNLAGFSLLTGYIISYLIIAGLVSMLFVAFKRSLGDKVSGDAFGKSEYYLGMPAGLIRCLCILISMLAILNARAFTSTEVKEREKYQKENYGQEFFPGLNSIQVDVFEKSLTGPFFRKYMSFLLINPTFPNVKKPNTGRPDVALP